MTRFKRINEALIQAESRLTYARACASILETDAWKVIAATLADSERAYLAELSSDRETTPHRISLLKGSISTLRWLRGLPKLRADEVAEYERQAKHLRAKVTDMQNRGLDKPPLDIRAEVHRLRKQLETAR